MSHLSISKVAGDLAGQIGRNLRTARKRRRKTIREAAEMAGVSVSTVKRAEAGDPAVSFGTFLALAEVLQLLDTVSFGAPEIDTIGLTLEKQRLPERVRRKKDKRLDF